MIGLFNIHQNISDCLHISYMIEIVNRPYVTKCMVIQECETKSALIHAGAARMVARRGVAFFCRRIHEDAVPCVAAAAAGIYGRIYIYI